MALQVQQQHPGAGQIAQSSHHTAEQRYRLALDTIHQQQLVIRQLEDAVMKGTRCEQLKFDACVGTNDTDDSDAARQVSAFAQHVQLRAEIHKIRLQRRVAAERHQAQLKALEDDLRKVRQEAASLIDLVQLVDSQRAPQMPGKK
jgi:hypothetical protein